MYGLKIEANRLHIFITNFLPAMWIILISLSLHSLSLNDRYLGKTDDFVAFKQSDGR